MSCYTALCFNRKCQPTPMFLHRNFHGQKNLGGYSPWGHKGSDKTEGLSAHTHTHTRIHTHGPVLL